MIYFWIYLSGTIVSAAELVLSATIADITSQKKLGMGWFGWIFMIFGWPLVVVSISVAAAYWLWFRRIVRGRGAAE